MSKTYKIKIYSGGIVIAAYSGISSVYPMATHINAFKDGREIIIKGGTVLIEEEMTVVDSADG